MRNPKIFVSYSSQDRDWAEAFARSLKASGAEVWFDQWSIPLGGAWPPAFEKGFRESDIIAVVVNLADPFRPDLWFDFGAAIGMGKRIVPILPKESQSVDLPYPLRVRQGILRETPEETAKKLVATTMTE
jgi:TIR domain